MDKFIQSIAVALRKEKWKFIFAVEQVENRSDVMF